MDLDEVGSGTKALFCLTNNTNCCENPSQGDWFGPLATKIPNMTKMESFYTSRGPSAVHLNKAATGSSHTGVFHCRISDADGNEKIIYIAIYNNEDGRIKVRILKQF